MRSRRFKFAGLSTLAGVLAGFLDLRFATHRSRVTVLEALVTLMGMAVRALGLAFLSVVVRANGHTLNVVREVAVLVLT